MTKANIEIRQEAIKKGVRLWQIADRYGINDVNFTKKLRKELQECEKKKILNLIELIADEQKEVK